LHKSADNSAGILLACLVCCLSACGDPAPAAPETASACGTDGEFVAEVYGGVRASIDWRGESLACEGMPRPNGQGARLRFAGTADVADGTRHLAFILGLPDLRPGQTGSELATNVTLVEEGTGRFFGTRDTGSCWTDVETHERVAAAVSSGYRISGILYCVTPLANVNDNSSVSFTDLRFTGRLDWKTAE
jgi:hypothetical protein